MDLSIIFIGAAKLGFGLLVGIVGITTSARLIKRAIGLADINALIKAQNVAVGLSLSAAIIAMGMLVEPAVSRTFNALDLIQHTAQNWTDVLWIVAYALGLTSASLLIGAAVIVSGVRAAIQLTPDLDEIEEIVSGNMACAIILVAVMVVLAFLVREGLDTMLTGFLPLPVLGRIGPA